MEQTCTIVSTPLETLNNENIQDLAQKLSSSLTLTVFSKQCEQLKFLVQYIMSSYLSDICYIDDSTNPVSLSQLFDNISAVETQQITFLRLNKLII